MSNKIKGTKKDDLLIGDESDNEIHGKKGNDEIWGLGGNDKLKGNQGDDFLDGGSGDDILEGNDGRDILLGGEGNDLLVGDGSAKDYLPSGSGGSGKGSGKDTSNGSGKGSGNSSEKASGSSKGSGKSSEKASGSSKGSGKSSGSAPSKGSSKGSGSGSDDENDYLDGGAGNDRLFAEDGDDTGNYNVSENLGAEDHYDGGDGIDTLFQELTLEEWLDPNFQTDLASYLEFLDQVIDPLTGEADDSVFQFTAFDLSASGWENIRITVDGNETNPIDEPVTANNDDFSTNEDSGVLGNVLADNGNGADAIPDYLREVTLISSAVGNLQLNGDGSFEYDTAGQFEHLAANQIGEDTFTYKVEDADGDTDSAQVTVSITGVNDKPTLASGTLNAMEDGGRELLDLSALGDDIDTDDNGSTLTYSIGAASEGIVSINGTNLEFNPGTDFQDLAQNETRNIILDLTANDSHGASATSQITVTVSGVNDAPVINGGKVFGEVTIGGDLGGEFIEDSGDSGTLSFSDVDLTDSHSVDVEFDDSALGTLSAVITTDTTNIGTGGEVSWDYSVPVEAYQHLREGDTATETFNVVVSDENGGSTEQDVVITIYGVNDPATLSSDTVDIVETDVQQTVTGQLTITDVDDGEEEFVAQTTSQGAYGSFSIDSLGSWSFTTDGALDYLAEGEQVSDLFVVESIDGTQTTVTVNITGTADGPTAVVDTNTLTASTVSQTTDNTVYWADWKTITPLNNAFGEVEITGTISLPDRDVNVSFIGQIYAPSTNISDTNTTNWWHSYDGSQWNPGGEGVYTSSEVPNGPAGTNFDYIALANVDTPRNLSFSEPIENLFFAISSMNRNGYLFDQPFTVVSSADGPNDRGNWGWTDSYTLTVNNGQYGISTPSTGNNEFHGILSIDNAISSLTWFGQAYEVWNGFTIGTYGAATSSTVSGNVIVNDDVGGNPPISVSNVGGTNMNGESVTLTLSSGAILKVDKDGDYLYDDNSAFGYLGAGQTHTDTVSYTIEDTAGNSDSADLSITVTGINDAPEAKDDTGIVTLEDLPATIPIAQLLANDTDIDSGDTMQLTSVQDAVNGTVSISGGNIVFVPDANFNGEANFNYTIQDGAGAQSTANVTVNIAPVPDVYTPQNLASNGSFENGLTNWTALLGGVDVVGDWEAADGTRLVDLNAFERGGVQQTIATEAGKTYEVSFALSKNPGETGTAIAEVSAGDNTQQFAFSESNATSNMRWANQIFSFTADDTSEVLSFVSLTPATPQGFPGDAQGPALDEVVVVTNELVNGFDVGPGGDIVNLGPILSSIDAPLNGTAFSNGFVRFHQSGADTLVQIDADGGTGGQDFITAMTLVGVQLTQSDVGNYSF